MEDYIEDYSYNNNFWEKSSVLYRHLKEKFAEFISIGKLLEKIILLIEEFCNKLNIAKKKCDESEAKKLTTLWIDERKPNEIVTTKKKKNDYIPENFYIPLEKPDKSSRSNGIKMLFDYFDRVIICLNSLNDNIKKISTSIDDRQENYQSTMSLKKNCDDNLVKYNASLSKLDGAKQKYYGSINSAIKYHLSSKNKGEDEKKYRLEIEEKRKEYKKQVKLVEDSRVEYLTLQGHVFAAMDEFERYCTDELKVDIKNFAKYINNFAQSIQMNENELKIIEKIDGKEDNKLFTDENKSLRTGPKKFYFKEYSQDMKYYLENFNFLKRKFKGLDDKRKAELTKNISKTVANFLNEIIIEEKDDINKEIIDISRCLKENQLTEEQFNYLINSFEKNFNRYLDWKKRENAHTNNYRKVGEIYDDRYFYMHTFLGYFNKTRVSNKCLNEENFNYFCKAVEKILELNMNEDIDYGLCDLVVILSSTFYMTDKTKPSGKKYISEVIRKYPLMNKESFWVGLCKYELNQELQSQKSEKDGVKEEITPGQNEGNSILAKLMSVTFNLLQFITDSELFNQVVSDIFDHCKLDKEKREMIAGMIENQIEVENISYIKLNKDLILNKKNL